MSKEVMSFNPSVDYKMDSFLYLLHRIRLRQKMNEKEAGDGSLKNIRSTIFNSQVGLFLEIKLF